MLNLIYKGKSKQELAHYVLRKLVHRGWHLWYSVNELTSMSPEKENLAALHMFVPPIVMKDMEDGYLIERSGTKASKLGRFYYKVTDKGRRYADKPRSDFVRDRVPVTPVASIELPIKNQAKKRIIRDRNR